MVRRTAALIGAAAALGVVVAGVPASAARAGEGDRTDPIALVGGQPILAGDLEGYLGLRPPKGGEGAVEEGVRRRLEELVVAEVLYQEALRQGIDREPEVRQTIRQVLAQRLLEREVDRPAMTRKIEEEELKQYYDGHLGEYARAEEARAAEIFFAASADGESALREGKRARAEAVLAEAQALADSRFGFGELLLKHSEQPPGRALGDTGFFDREGGGRVPRELAAAAFALGRPGAIAPTVVSSAEGFHVVMLTGRRDALSRPLEEESVRREIEDRIRSEERRRALEAYVGGLRAGARVSVDETALGKVLAGMAPPADAEGAGAGRPAPAGASEAPPPVPGAGR